MLNLFRNIGRKTNVTEWQKGAIVFGHAHRDKVNDVVKFAVVSKRNGQWVYKQSGVVRSQLKIGNVIVARKRYSSTGTAAILHT